MCSVSSSVMRVYIHAVCAPRFSCDKSKEDIVLLPVIVV